MCCVQGDLGKLYNKWRDDMIKCIAYVEALIDFGEDDDIDPDIAAAGT
jgi:tRNA modification GTPase